MRWDGRRCMMKKQKLTHRLFIIDFYTLIWSSLIITIVNFVAPHSVPIRTFVHLCWIRAFCAGVWHFLGLKINMSDTCVVAFQICPCLCCSISSANAQSCQHTWETPTASMSVVVAMWASHMPPSHSKHGRTWSLFRCPCGCTSLRWPSPTSIMVWVPQFDGIV